MASTQQQSTISCPNPPVSHLERHGYLFGYPIAHSMSPMLHQTLFDRLGLRWSQLFLPSTDMSQFLDLVKDPRLFGASVTMPHKLAIMPHLDSLTEECRAVGACNTIFRRGSQLVGANTDTIGIRDAFLKNLPAPDDVFRGRPGMVIGGGGAARSACYALIKLMGFRTVYLVNRDAGEVEAVTDWCTSQGYGEGLVHVSTAAQAASLDGPGAIVACIPNYPPTTEAEREARQVVQALLGKGPGAMLEMCYHPVPWTELAAIAQEAGWQVILGTEAMIYQGIRAHSYWHDLPVNDTVIQEAKEAVQRELSKSKL